MKMEFSKKIFIVMFTNAFIFTALTFYVAAIGGDATPLANIVFVLWGSVATGELAYYSKAKAENLLKIGNTVSQEVLDKASQVKMLGE